MNSVDQLLKDWEVPAPPASDVVAHARGRLIELISAEAAGKRSAQPLRSPFSRLSTRLLLVAAVALGLVVGITFVPDLPSRSGDPSTAGRRLMRPVANASEALERAADAADERGFVAPRPDQWIYLKTEKTFPSEGPGGFATGGPLRTEVEEVWHRADGNRVAFIGEDGKVHVSLSMGAVIISGEDTEYVYEPGIQDPLPADAGGLGSSFPPSDFDVLAGLPTEPAALKEWALSTIGPRDYSPDQRESYAYGQLITLMRYNLLPPKLESAIFRTLREMPGVILTDDAVDVAGRPALAIGYLQDGWVYQELLLDRQNFRYLGERSIAAADKTISALDGSWKVKKGTIQLFTARLASGVVDQPGERAG